MNIYDEIRLTVSQLIFWIQNVKSLFMFIIYEKYYL